MHIEMENQSLYSFESKETRPNVQTKFSKTLLAPFRCASESPYNHIRWSVGGSFGRLVGRLISRSIRRSGGPFKVLDRLVGQSAVCFKCFFSYYLIS